MTSPKVFISYSYSDAEWALKFAEELGKYGLNVWPDRYKITSADKWADEMEKELRESQVVVFLIQPSELEATDLHNAHIFLELGAALSSGKTIVPVVTQNLDYNKLPPPLRRIQSLIRTSPEETARELAQALELLSREAA
jgi:hypothetical protein